MNQGVLKNSLREIANKAVPPVEVDLWPQISDRLQRRKKSLRLKAMVPLVPIFIAIALLAAWLIFIGPEKAFAALRGLLGYVPGVGVVDEGMGLRILEEPVNMELDGIAFFVEQAMVDSERTIVIYRAEGIPEEAHLYSDDYDSPFCLMVPELEIPGGAVLQMIQATLSGIASGYEVRLVYPALPLNVSEATLVITCPEGFLPGLASRSWHLPLRFVLAPPGFEVLPIIEIANESEGMVASNGAEAMGLYLEKVIELPDAYILIGSFRQGRELPNAIVMGVSEQMKILDVNGRELQHSIPSDIDVGSEVMDRFYWDYEVPKGFAAPITLRLEAVDVEFPVVAPIVRLDTGPDPQIGQEWELNQQFVLSGHEVLLVKAVRNENGYTFYFSAGPSVVSVSMVDMAYQSTSGFGGGWQGEIEVGFEYKDPVPTGLLEFSIRSVIAQYPGPWMLTWAPLQGGPDLVRPDNAP
jgi:hypothetical protein